jgi:hypothetical protein
MLRKTRAIWLKLYCLKSSPDAMSLFIHWKTVR